MSYLWQEFNIKTFDAETIVYRDGGYCADLSTLPDGPIDKKLARPVHIIYIGEISGNCRLNIDISAANQPVYLSAQIKNKKPAFFNIFVKNAGKKSFLRGHVLLQNYDELTFDCTAQHIETDTDILIQTKLFGDINSKSKLSGIAEIMPGAKNCESDIGFGAMLEKGARVEFMPGQKISAVPKSAQHSASIYAPREPQILFLRQAGLSGAETDAALKEAFMNDFSLF